MRKVDIVMMFYIFRIEKRSKFDKWVLKDLREKISKVIEKSARRLSYYPADFFEDLQQLYLFMSPTYYSCFVSFKNFCKDFYVDYS